MLLTVVGAAVTNVGASVAGSICVTAAHVAESSSTTFTIGILFLVSSHFSHARARGRR